MKQNSEFMMQEVAGVKVIVPVGAAVVDFPGMITVNDTGAYIWQLLETEQTVESLAEALLTCYEVTQAQAVADVEAFLTQLQPTGAVLG